MRLLKSGTLILVLSVLFEASLSVRFGGLRIAKNSGILHLIDGRQVYSLNTMFIHNYNTLKRNIPNSLNVNYTIYINIKIGQIHVVQVQNIVLHLLEIIILLVVVIIDQQ